MDEVNLEEEFDFVPEDYVSIEAPVSEDKVDSLEKPVVIKRIGNINESLWLEAENIRKNQHVKEETPKEKGLGRAAFVSISAMALTTMLVSLGIVVCGIMILN